MQNYRLLTLLILIIYSEAIFLPKAHNSKPIKRFEVIVIGGGLSGATAANYLASHDYQVLVLQAQDYIGGRTKTSSVVWPMTNNQVHYDQGASWMHKYNPSHPLSLLAKKLKVELAQTNFDNGWVCDDQGNDVEEDYDQSKYEQFMDEVHQLTGMTIQQAIQKLDPQMLQDPMFMNFLAQEYEGDAAADISKLTSRSHSDLNTQNDHREQMFVVNGYNKFALFLVKHDNIEVKLSKIVSSVQKMKGNFSRVTCKNGEVYQASHVIVSVSLGVLKKNSIKFNPNLPQQKIEAINKIGFGNLYKIFILINKTIPKQKQHVIRAIESNVNNRGFAPMIYNLEAIAGTPGYVVFMTGNKADEVEAMEEEELKEKLAQKLSICLDVELSQQDLAIRRSGWLSNPHFYGTYTYQRPQTKKQHFRELAKPIFENQWHFCGEHTHLSIRSETYGAYESGINAAKGIVQEVQKESWLYRN